MSKAAQNDNSVEQPPLSQSANYMLKLYIAGHTPRSVQAIDTLTSFCKTYLNGRYTLEVVDIYLQPDAAVAEGIITLPTLLRKQPLPQRKLTGDLSDEKKLRIWLGLETYN